MPAREKQVLMLMIFSSLLILIILYAFTATGWAASGIAKVIINDIDTSNFPIVKAYVSVWNEEGGHVPGLGPAAFQVKEDNVLRPAEVTQENQGIFLAILIDLSGSMADIGMTGQRRIEEARDLAREILYLDGRSLMDIQSRKDLVTVIGFGDVLTPTVKPTNDYILASNEIYLKFDLPAQPQNTALFDAAYQALEEMSSPASQIARVRKAILILSDGEDTASKTRNMDMVVTRARQLDVPIYTIGLGDENNPNNPLKPGDLKRLAGFSGGRYNTYVYVDNVRVEP